MKKRFLGTALTTTLAISGCTVSTPEDPHWVDAPAVVVQHEDTKRPVLKIGDAAIQHLSPAVAKKADVVARVDRENRGYASATATKLGYLTSGHVLRTRDGQLLPLCGDMTVTAQTAESTKPRQQKVTAAASVRQEQKNAYSSGSWRDLALVKTEKAPAGDVAQLDKKNRDMAVGDRLTFINFQPTHTLPRDRTPNSEPYTERSPSGTEPYNAPAIYTGQVLSDPTGDRRQIAVLLGHGTSFGKTRDTVALGGASGGEVIADNGVTKGVTTGVIEVTLPIEQIEEQYNVDIRGEHASTGQVAFVQPVNEMLLNALRKELTPFKTSPC
jgi:hypothetical protein